MLVTGTKAKRLKVEHSHFRNAWFGSCRRVVKICVNYADKSAKKVCNEHASIPYKIMQIACLSYIKKRSFQEAKNMANRFKFDLQCSLKFLKHV